MLRRCAGLSPLSAIKKAVISRLYWRNQQALVTEKLQKEQALVTEKLQREQALVTEKLQREHALTVEKMEREKALLDRRVQTEKARSDAKVAAEKAKRYALEKVLDLSHSSEFQLFREAQIKKQEENDKK